MNTLAMLMSHPLMERLGWTLLHFLWQGALAALAVRLLDAQTHQGIDQAWGVLTRADGMPLGTGANNYLNYTDKQGAAHYSSLPPGQYTLAAGHTLGFYGDVHYRSRKAVPVTVKADGEAVVESALLILTQAMSQGPPVAQPPPAGHFSAG